MSNLDPKKKKICQNVISGQKLYLTKEQIVINLEKIVINLEMWQFNSWEIYNLFEIRFLVSNYKCNKSQKDMPTIYNNNTDMSLTLNTHEFCSQRVAWLYNSKCP